MDTPNEKKRKTDHDSDNTGGGSSRQPTGDNSAFTRFLLIEATDEGSKISNLSPFVIEKQIESIAGVPKSVKKLRTGNLLIEVDKPSHSKNLMSITTFFGLPCKCYPHRSLNSSRGVIRCPDLAGVSETEIVEGLKEQHVTFARRITIKKENKQIPTNTIILTFGTSILPRTIKVGYLITKVDVYIPNPLQCYNCFKFGHNERNCKGDHACHLCGGNGYAHDDDKCKNPLVCLNCKEPHSAKSRACKVWKTEKEVLQVKFTQSLGFPEARKIVNARYAPPEASYSSVTKTSVNKSIQCTDAATQTVEVNANSRPPVANKPTPAITQNIPIYMSSSTTTSTVANKPTPPANIIQNTPNYKPTDKSSSSGARRTSSPGAPRVNQTPRQKINLGTDRVPKGSNDPIRNHNKFSPLEEMEDDREDFSSSAHPPKNSKESKITKINPLEKMQQ